LSLLSFINLQIQVLLKLTFKLTESNVATSNKCDIMKQNGNMK